MENLKEYKNRIQTRINALGSFFSADGLKAPKIGRASLNKMDEKIFEIRRQLELSKSLLKAQSDLGEGLILIDARNGRFLYLNNAFCKISGYGPVELMDMESFLTLIAPEERPAIEERMKKHLLGEKVPTHYELSIVHKEGARVRLEVSVKESSKEDKSRLIALIRDVTARKKAEENALKTRKEAEEKFHQASQSLSKLREAVEGERAAREKAEEALLKSEPELKRLREELKEFATVVSRDLQEPLCRISAQLRMFSSRYRNAFDGKGQELLRFVSDGMKGLVDEVCDLLNYSRVGLQPASFRPTHSQYALEQALGRLQLASKEKEISVTHSALPLITADLSQIIELFEHLLANGVKFHGTEPLGIHVSAETKEMEWVFSLKHTGLAPEQQDRIFSLFHRLNSGKSGSGGIGLAICKKIVQQHGGRVWIKSEAGSSVSFCFTIARRPAEWNSKEAELPSDLRAPEKIAGNEPKLLSGVN